MIPDESEWINLNWYFWTDLHVDFSGTKRASTSDTKIARSTTERWCCVNLIYHLVKELGDRKYALRKDGLNRHVFQSADVLLQLSQFINQII